MLMRTWSCILALAWTWATWGDVATNDWPMLGHDGVRSGATAAEVRPPFERKWYRLFTDEGIMSGVQPIVAEGKVFIGTLRGKLHALDAESGKTVWSFTAGGAILHSAAAADGKVFFGCADGGIYALNTAHGEVAWTVPTGAAVWNAPALHNGVVFIGSRDQHLYAISANNGHVLWTAPTGGPLLNSPAVDPKTGRVYIGSEDMCVYAFALKDGSQVWRSERLPGVSMRGYHPVIAPDSSVLVTTAPGIGVDTFQNLLLEMVKSIFGDFASWRRSKEANDILREENFALMQKPETYRAQMDYLRKRLTEERAWQTFFVLEPATGQQKFVAPVVYAESMNGPGAPAVVTPKGEVIIKFQALLKSRYEHYSPFLNVGQLDTATGQIRPIMDQTRVYGWHDSLLLVHDEQSQLAVGGRVLMNTHQDNVNGFDLDTREGFTDPFCLGIHEPKPGEAISIWRHLLRNKPLPPGKEWIARGTGVYGGGSVLDTSVSVAGDSFYYLPTHELNAGAAVIAYRMKLDFESAPEVPLEPAPITAEEWARVKELPWDWDTLESRRLDHVLTALPAAVPGTRRQPLIEEGKKAAGAISDADLDRAIWEAPTPTGPPAAPKVFTAGLSEDLAEAVRELISIDWRPLLFPSGKFPEESYRLFTEPTETLFTLALAYPLLQESLQEQVRTYVRNQQTADGPLAGPLGERTYRPDRGEVRSSYEPAPEKLLKLQGEILRTDLARLYPIWLWAHVTGDWTQVERHWPKLKGLIEQRPGKMEDDCRNGYLAGLVAYCRIAERMKDPAAREAGQNAARRALRERLEFELAHTQGGLIWPVPKLRSAFSRWHFLTPEIGRFLGEHAGEVHRGLMGRYVDLHRPTWWLAWNVETLMRNECPYEFPSVAGDIFAARRWILGQSAEELGPCIDRPWCRADLHYIQKLVLTLEAARPRRWSDVRGDPGA
jgi:hypothetical protein